MDRLCSLHGCQLDGAGSCPTCRQYEAEEAAAAAMPDITLTPVSAAALARVTKSRDEQRVRRATKGGSSASIRRNLERLK